MRGTSKIEWELALGERFSPMYQKITDDKLKVLQKAYLKMYKKFDAECRRHHIHSYMVAGTLIGSLRHGGYIPWDDLRSLRGNSHSPPCPCQSRSYSSAYEIGRAHV